MCSFSQVTASYQSPQMQELAKEAEEAGITIVNEVGKITLAMMQ